MHINLMAELSLSQKNERMKYYAARLMNVVVLLEQTVT